MMNLLVIIGQEVFAQKMLMILLLFKVTCHLSLLGFNPHRSHKYVRFVKIIEEAKHVITEEKRERADLVVPTMMVYCSRTIS